MAISKNLRTFLFVNDERFVTPRLDAVVNLDIPILQWRSDRFNLALDTLFDGWKSTETVPAVFEDIGGVFGGFKGVFDASPRHRQASD